MISTALKLQHSSDESELQAQSRAKFVRGIANRTSPSSQEGSDSPIPDQGGTTSNPKLTPDGPDGAIPDLGVTASNPKIIRFPEYTPTEVRPSDSFYALEEWEGTIQEVHEDRLTGLIYRARKTERTFTEEVSIPLDIISPEDVRHLARGGVFRLLIGYSQRLGGPRVKSTLVYLRRWAPPSKEDLCFSSEIGSFFAGAEVIESTLGKPIDSSIG